MSSQNAIRAEDLERVKTQLIAEAIYAQDNQATLARWYGGALTTGLAVDDIRSWPDRIRAVTAEQVRDAAQKWLDKKRSVTGYLIKDTSAEARGEAFVIRLSSARSASRRPDRRRRIAARCAARRRRPRQRSSGWSRPAASRPGSCRTPPCR